MHQVALGHGHEKVQVALDQCVLRHQRARVVALVQQRQRRACQPPLLLDRLVWIGVAADVDRLALVVLPREFVAEDFGQVGLGEELGFEVQAGREVEVGVGRAGITVDAPASYDDLESVHFVATPALFVGNPLDLLTRRAASWTLRTPVSLSSSSTGCLRASQDC